MVEAPEGALCFFLLVLLSELTAPSLSQLPRELEGVRGAWLMVARLPLPLLHGVLGLATGWMRRGLGDICLLPSLPLCTLLVRLAGGATLFRSLLVVGGMAFRRLLFFIAPQYNNRATMSANAGSKLTKDEFANALYTKLCLEMPTTKAGLSD